MKTRFPRQIATVAIAAVMIAAPTLVRGAIVETADPARVEASTVPGVTTETFDGFSIAEYSSLRTTIGTLSTSGQFAIVAADSYGGASGSGTTFDQIVFSNSGTTGTGFDSDNWSVSAVSPVHEPSSVGLAGMGLSLCILTFWRRRQLARAGGI